MSRFNALLNNFSTAQDAATTSAESYGSALREQEQYNQSLEARLNRLQTAWYDLANTAGSTILYDAIVVTTEFLKNITSLGSSASGSIVGVSVAFSALATALLFVSTTFRNFAISLVTGTVSLNGVATASSRATIALTALRGAVTGLLAATGVGLAITALGTGIGLLVNRISENIQQSEAFATANQKNIDALTTNKEEVDRLIASYTNLTNIKNNSTLSTTQEQELIDVQNRLAELYPALIDRIDASGNAHLKSVDAIGQVNDATEELIAKEKELAQVQAQESFSDINSNIEKTIAQRERLAKQIEKYKGRSNPDLENIAQLEVHLAQLDVEIANSTQEIADNVLKVADAFTEVGQEIDDTINGEIRDALSGLDFSELDASELEDFAKKIAEIRIALSESLSSGDEGGFSKAREELNDLINSVGVSSDQIANSTLNFEKLSEAANKLGPSLESADESMGDLGESADVTSEKIAELQENLTKLETVQEQLAGVSQASVDSSQELVFLYEQLTMRLNGLNDAELQSLLKKQQLTAEEKAVVQALQQRGDVITQLNVLYPQWATLQGEAISLSKEQVAQIKKEEEANRILLEAYQLASEGKLTAEQEKTVNQAAGTKARIDNIKAEIAALNVLQKEAQKAYDNIVKNEDIYNDDNAGRGALRAGVILGQAQFKTEQATSDLGTLTSQLDGLTSSIKTTIKTVKESDSASKSSTSATKAKTEAEKKQAYITDQYKQKLDELNLAIEKQQKLQNDYPNYSNNYRKAIQSEIKIQQQKLDLINSQTKALEKQIKAGKIAQTGSVSDPKSATTTVSKSSTVKSGNAWTGRLTSAQGNRVLGGKSEYHRGIDIASPQGTKLIANIAGKVIASGSATSQGYHSSYGNIVVVQDKDGNKHLYAHLQKAIAKLGTTIEKGTQIGNIGSTGRSTGSHLHYEVTNNGKILDAASFAKEARSGSLSITQQVTETVQAVDNTQQAIDEAKSTLLSLQSDALAQQELIAELQAKIVESTLAGFDYRRGNFESNIDHELAKIKTLDKESVRYTKTLDLINRYQQQQQQVNQEELAYLDQLLEKGGLNEIQTDELTARKLELKTAIHELNNEIQNFKLDNLTKKYEDSIDTINDKISHQEAKLQHLNTSSERYTQTLRNIADGFEESSMAVEEHIKDLQHLIDTQQVNGDNLDATVDKINDLKVELENLHAQIQEKNYEVIVNIKTQYDDQTDDLQFEIDRSKAIQGMYEEGTANYNNEITKQIELTKQQMSLYDKSRREIQKEMNQVGLNAEQKKDLMEQMEDLSLSYVNAEASIRSMTKALEDSNKAMLESIADAYINAYKEYVREISEEHMNLLDSQAEAEQEAYENRKKMLDDELDLFRKNVEEKLRLIQREEDARNYQNDLDELESDRNKLQGKYNELLLDNSYEAKKKREDILEELDEIDKNIAEHKHQRDIELQEQALNDLLERKEEEFEIQQEHNDKLYDDAVKLIDRQREYWQKYYRDLENDERKFAQIREDILNGHFDKVNAEFESMISQLEATMPRLVDTMDGTMQGVGTAIRQNVIDQLRDAMSMVDEYINKMNEMSSINLNNKFTDDFNPNEGKGDLPASTSPSDPPPSSGKQDLIKGIGDIKVVVGKYMTDILANQEPQAHRAKNIRDKAHALAAEGRSQGSTIPVNQHVDSTLSGFSEQDKENVKDYIYGNAGNILQTDYLQNWMRDWAASLDTGGYLNFSSNSGGIDGKGGKAIIGHPGEVMLNKVQTDRLLDNIETSDSILSKISNITSAFSNIMNNFVPNLSATGGLGDVTINFGDVNNATQQQAQNFATEFINRINTIKGGF